MASFNLSGSQRPIHAKSRRVQRRRRLLLSMCLLPALAIFVFAAPGQGTFAQEGENEDTREHENTSVAACSEVSYRQPEGYATRTPDQGFELEGPVFVTPPSADGPTLVDLGLFIIQITEINVVENTFRLTGFLDLVWCDPRKAFDPEKVGVKEEMFLEDAAALTLAEIWWPDIDFANEAAPREISNQELIIFSDGTLEYKEKFSAVLEARYDLRNFPFDEQTLEIEIESFAWNDEFLVFHQEEEKIGFGTGFEIPEWHTESVETSLESRREIRDRHHFPNF